MNPNIELLHSYPFQKLAKLKEGITPPTELNPIFLSIGEPKHAPPKFALETLKNNLAFLSNYPVTSGTPELRETAARWCEKRYKLSENQICVDQVLSVNGTREALFSIAQAVIDHGTTTEKPVVISPNPFYQIYEGAALLANAEPYYLNCDRDNHFLPDLNSVPNDIWERCQLFYFCNPGNPTGSVAPLDYLQQLIKLSEKHDFIIASDECYSEIYFDEPPVGILEACNTLSNTEFKRCIVFQSLSKRSNLPGLRSGFVVGDKQLISGYLKYRTYHGCAMPVPSQLASIDAWNDERHVEANRKAYKEKFDKVIPILKQTFDVIKPDAAFFLWLPVPIDEETFTRELFAKQNVTVLPGSYLARDSKGQNPGKNFVRIALVAELDECIEAANRLVEFAQEHL